MRKRFLLLLTGLLASATLGHAQTGIAVPEMASCDAQVATFMSTYAIPGLTLAIAKDGRLVYSRGFGNANRTATEATQPHTLFRIASLSKPLTAVAVMKLIEQGQLSLSDKAFGPAGILASHPVFSQATITDARIYDITVQQLLEHTAGWDRDVDCFATPTSPYPWHFDGCDPIVAPLTVTQTNGTPNPATAVDMVKYLLEKGLSTVPGTHYAYSNIGYLVLGRIIEQKSGMTYADYVQSQIFAPLGICDIRQGHNLLADKMEREGEYVGNGYTTLSCYGTGALVPWEYGGFDLEAMDAHGGWVATARDLVRLLVAIDGFATKPDILSASTLATMTAPSTSNAYYAKGWQVNSANNWWHTGALDGTASILVRSSGGYTWAMVMNKRIVDSRSNAFWGDLDNLPWGCVSSATTWPSHDLLAAPTTNSDNLTFSAAGSNSVTVNWTNGTGSRRLLVATASAPISAFPLDGTTYAAQPAFGAGDDLGGQAYVLYNGTGSSATITGLSPLSTYTFRLFDFNQSVATGNQPLYRLCGNTPAQFSLGVTGLENDAKAPETLHLFPSVTERSLTVTVPRTTAATAYTIRDLTGRAVLGGALSVTGTTMLDVRPLAPGIYYLTTVGSARREQVRFVKIAQ